mgnify:FL=1
MSEYSIQLQNERTRKMIEGAGEDIAKAFDDNRIKKQSELELMRETVNQTEVYWNDKVSDLKKSVKSVAPLDDQIHAILNTNIQSAADAKIGLLNETDQEVRRKYQKQIKNAETIVSLMAGFSGALLNETSQMKQQAPSVYGQEGSYIVNGKDTDESLDYLSAINILNNQNKFQDTSNVDLSFDEYNEDLVLSISGKREDGKAFSLKLNATDYMKADDVDSGLISPVPNFKEAMLQANTYAAGKEGIKAGFLMEGVQDVDIKGGEYQMIAAKEISVGALRNQLRKEIFVGTADGVLATNSRNYMKNTWEVSLEGFTGDISWNDFNNIKNPREQRDLLATAFTEKALFAETTGLLSSLETTGEGEDKKYWNPTANIKRKEGYQSPTKEKPTASQITRGENQSLANKRAKQIADKILKSGQEKNGDFLKNKKFNGKPISNVRFSGDDVIITTDVSTTQTGITSKEDSFNLNSQDELETLMDAVAEDMYGNDAAGEAVRDAIKVYLKDRKENRPLSTREIVSANKKAQDLIDKYKQK